MIYVLKMDIDNDVIKAKESSTKNGDKKERSWNAVASGIANERLIEKLTGTSFVNLDYNMKKNYSESDMLPAGYDIGVKGPDKEGLYWFGKSDFCHPQFLVEKTEVMVPVNDKDVEPAYAIKRLWIYNPVFIYNSYPVEVVKTELSDKGYERYCCNMNSVKRPVKDMDEIKRILEKSKVN